MSRRIVHGTAPRVQWYRGIVKVAAAPLTLRMQSGGRVPLVGLPASAPAAEGTPKSRADPRPRHCRRNAPRAGAVKAATRHSRLDTRNSPLTTHNSQLTTSRFADQAFPASCCMHDDNPIRSADIRDFAQFAPFCGGRFCAQNGLTRAAERCWR